jgi:hypothetical protein
MSAYAIRRPEAIATFSTSESIAMSQMNFFWAGQTAESSHRKRVLGKGLLNVMCVLCLDGVA